MKFLRILILFFIFQFALNIHAQVYLPNAKTCDENSIGLGIGQDFGGIGIGVLHYGGNKNMGIFGGIGYTIKQNRYSQSLHFGNVWLYYSYKCN